MRGPGGAERGNTGCGADRKPAKAFARTGISSAENGSRGAAGGKRAMEADSSSRAAEIPAAGKRREEVVTTRSATFSTNWGQVEILRCAQDDTGGENRFQNARF